MNDRQTTATRSNSVFAPFQRLPLLFAAIALALENFLIYFTRATEPRAISPWEPAIAMEAVRLNHGLPLYELGQNAHASHLYGPLLTATIAAVFHFTGLNLLAARCVFMLFGLVLSALMAFVVIGKKRFGDYLLPFLLFWGVNLRSYMIFTTAQPDCVAASLAIGGLALWITRDGKPWRATVALMLFVCGTYFKQTSAIFAMIPLIYEVFWVRPLSLRRLFIAAVPPATIVFALAVTALAAPAVFHGMVVVPGALHIRYDKLAPISLYYLGTFPLLFLALAALFQKDRLDEREKWILAGLAILVPISAWTMAKSGGSYNSLLFGYIAMAALVAVELPSILRPPQEIWPAKRFGLSLMVCAATLCSYFFQQETNRTLLFSPFAGQKYDQIIQIAKNLPGTVISPEDATIAYLAKGYIGRSLYLELDTHAENGEWPSKLPQGLQTELENADYVIQVKSYLPSDLLPKALEASGFAPVSSEWSQASSYTLWKHRR